MASSVGIIVCCDLAGKGLGKTLRSFANQEFDDIEVVVVGGPQNLREFDRARKKLKLDSRFRFLNSSGNIADSLNLALSDLDVDALMFALPCDRVFASSIEVTYGALVNGNADIVVIDSWKADFLLKDRVEVEAEGEELPEGFTFLDSFDPLMLKYSFPFNKLFSMRLIKSRKISFRDFGAASVWHFGVQCSLGADRICYVEKSMGRRYRFEPSDSAADAIDYQTSVAQAISDAYRDVAVMAEAALEHRIAAIDAERDASEFNRLTSVKYSLDSLLALGEARALCEKVLAHCWLLEGKTRREVAAKIDHLLDSAFSADRNKFRDEFGYVSDFVSDENGYSEERPIVSFVITPNCDPDVARFQVWNLLWQDYPQFEVIVPSMLGGACEEFAGIPIVRALDSDGNVAAYCNVALGEARGTYVVFLEDKLYWVASALSEAIGEMELDRVEFLALRPMRRYGKTNLPALDMAFDKSRCGTSFQSAYNVYDNSLNNKIIRRNALKTRGFSFSGRSARDSAALYERFSNRKLDKAFVRCDENNAFFVRRAFGWMPVAHLGYVLGESMRTSELGAAVSSIAENARLSFAETRLARPRVVDQMLFFTNRSSGVLTPNLRCVYDELEGENRIVMARELPHSMRYIQEIRRELQRSRIIITDDYLHELPHIELDDSQRVVQLWHAAGAFKKFGLDCYGTLRKKEHAIHRHYSAVMVSSEGVREIYSHALGVSLDKVLAMGTPRTDSLLDSEANDSIARAVLARHPQLDGKKVILYCPTFRQRMNKQVKWDVGINWGDLSEKLGDEFAFVVRKHPIEKFDLLAGNYPNIFELDQESTNDLLRICDVLVTDYSSVVFDAALLDKPMVFYCPDFDTFERDFYLDFPDDLPGDFVPTYEGLFEAIAEATAGERDARLSAFRAKYLGACDGHSAERIASFIRNL